jgi:hypothetical protein
MLLLRNRFEDERCCPIYLSNKSILWWWKMLETKWREEEKKQLFALGCKIMRDP